MSNLFTRSLSPGNAPGVQVNNLVDDSEITIDRSDQFFASMLKLPRGRIDRPFLVRAGEAFQKIGNGAWLGKRTQAYKSHSAVIEALRNGAAGAVLQRIVGKDSRNRFIVIKSGVSIGLTPTITNGVIRSVSVINQGSGYSHPIVNLASHDPRASVAIETNSSTGQIVRIILSGGTLGRHRNGDSFALEMTSFRGVLANVPADGTLRGAIVTITAPGVTNFRPRINKLSGPGSGEEFIIRVQATGVNAGKLTSVSVANGGRNYNLFSDSVPSILQVTDPSGYIGGGSSANVTITDIDDGLITALSVTNPRTADYLYGTPVISFKNTNGGNGSRAAAIATVTDGEISSITVTNSGSGYSEGKVSVVASLAENPAFSLRRNLPDPETEPYLLAIRDMECFNNGVIIALHSDEKSNANGDLINNSRIKVRIIDPARPRAIRYQFEGELTDGGVDDHNGSTFLPDTVSRKTDDIQVFVGSNSTVSRNSAMYGLDDDDNEKWIKSEVLMAFVESDQEYTIDDYRDARDKLARTPLNFKYISSVDSDSVALISELARLSYLTNKNLRFDVHGDTVAEAISFINSLNFIEREENHLLHAFWAPQLAEDPTRQNGSMQMGAATLNIAFACARNARKDSRGFAPKNYPIMGKDWELGKARRNIRSLVTPSRGQLNALAKAKINPVIYEDGRYIFSNAITCADVDVSLRRLIAVTDMSTSIDDAVVRYCNDVKGYPIDEAIKLVKDYMKSLFEGAEAAGWIVPSQEPEMLGRPYRYEVFVNPDRPYDTFIVNYWLRYQGTALYIYITQTYTR